MRLNHDGLHMAVVELQVFHCGHLFQEVRITCHKWKLTSAMQHDTLARKQAEQAIVSSMLPAWARRFPDCTNCARSACRAFHSNTAGSCRPTTKLQMALRKKGKQLGGLSCERSQFHKDTAHPTNSVHLRRVVVRVRGARTWLARASI